MATATPAELQQLISNLSDAAKDYDGTKNVLDAEKRAGIREHARKIFLALMSPDEMGLYHLLNFMEITAVRTCMELGVFVNIPEDRPISLQDLAATVEMTPAFLERILRILVGIGFLDQTEIDGGDYKHTKFSLAYRDPMSPSSGALFKAWYALADHVRIPFKTGSYLNNTIYPSSYYLFLTNHHRFHEYITTELPKPYPEPDNIFNNSINWHMGTQGQPWFVPVSSKPEIMGPFQFGMSMFDDEMPPAGPFYDFAQLVSPSDPVDRIQICDVGGGAGQVITKILAANPALDPKRCVLQDLPRVLELAGPAQGLGVQITPHDFHTEQPVKGAKAYYLRYVMHDYNDAQAINILSQLAAAMAPDSVVLIAESIMPNRIHEASLSVGVVDQVMLAIGGKERTIKEYEDVFAPAGLKLTNVYPVEGRNGALVEARLR